jgi:hypothetical protein
VVVVVVVRVLLMYQPTMVRVEVRVEVQVKAVLEVLVALEVLQVHREVMELVQVLVMEAALAEVVVARWDTVQVVVAVVG